MPGMGDIGGGSCKLNFVVGNPADPDNQWTEHDRAANQVTLTFPNGNPQQLGAELAANGRLVLRLTGNRVAVHVDWS